MTDHAAEQLVDFGWFRKLALDDVLPRWLGCAVTEEGLFLPSLDRQWRRKGDPVGTAVTQARLVYNFAMGFEHTGEDRYRRAADAGARFLAEHFRDREFGGWFHSVGQGGGPVDAHKNAYDFAFIIFGLSHAFRVTREAAFKAAALEAWRLLNERFRDAHGGYVRKMTRDFRPDEARRSQNPIMHLFEALLAAGDAGVLGYDEAEAVGKFVLSRLMRYDGQPCMPEFYGLAWDELSREDGGRCSVGHQFEWAYLLSAAVERGLPAWWIAPATDLLQFGLRSGCGRADGAILELVDYEGRVASAEPGWWEQCEAIRAMMHHAAVRGRADLWPAVERTVGFARRNFVDETYGGWYASVGTAPTADRPDKGGAGKVDYHVVGMCVEAMRLEERMRSGG